MQSALTNTLSNRMHNLRFKRKNKSTKPEDNVKKNKNVISPLAYTASVKTGSSIKSKVFILRLTTKRNLYHKWPNF